MKIDITEEYAVSFLSVMAQSLKLNIEVYDSLSDEDKKESGMLIDGNTRIMAEAIEIVVIKAKSNILLEASRNEN